MTATARSPRSPAELLLAVQLEQAHIPFEREVRFAPPRRWRADFMVGQNMAWPVRGRYLIEVDGGGFTGGHRRFGRMDDECEKGNAAALMGFRVLHFTPAMVEDGRAIAVIRQAVGLEQVA